MLNELSVEYNFTRSDIVEMLEIKLKAERDEYAGR